MQNSLLTYNDNDSMYIIFKLKNNIFAINSLNVIQIIKIMELEVPEKLPAFISGIINYENKPVNIIDLNALLDIKNNLFDANAKIILATIEGKIFGFICNKIADIIKTDKSKLAQIPYDKDKSFFEKIYYRDENEIYILNLGNIANYALKKSHVNIETPVLTDTDEKTKSILHERKIEYLEKTQKIKLPTLIENMQNISFKVGKFKYCIKMSDILGFYKLNEVKLTKIPCTPDFIFGIAGLKTDFVTIIDLKSYFHNEKSEITDKTTFIVINSSDFQIGFLADEISENVDIELENIIEKKQEEDTSKEFTEFAMGEEVYFILNIKQILENEKLYIK